MRKIEKAILCAMLTAVIAMTASGYSVFASQCQDIRQKVFRLHILANSDSPADQALKLKVRDRILASSATLFSASGDKAQAEAGARANLPKIEAIARDELRKDGSDESVHAEVVHMYFNTRTYGNVTLPAGDYDALRILIGSGKGHNWWCVLFPPLCLPSAESSDTQTRAQKLDDVIGGPETAAVVDNNGTEYVLKFKTVELFEDAKRYIEAHWIHRAAADPASAASAVSAHTSADSGQPVE